MSPVIDAVCQVGPADKPKAIAGERHPGLRVGQRALSHHQVYQLWLAPQTFPSALMPSRCRPRSKMKALFAAVIGLANGLVVAALAGTITNPFSITVTTTTGAAANYYVSATGNDANPGTQARPWLTPKHPVNCGDTLHLAPSQSNVGSNFDLGKWGVVSNCPSPTGRNTAKLICDGVNLQDCAFLHVFQSFRVDQPHWAVQGMYCNSAQATWSTCFGNAAPYVLFINDYVNAAGAGTGLSEYGAMIGGLVYGSGFGGGECFSGLSVFKPTEFDQKTGTHIFVAGSFYINNKNLPGCTDGEGIIIDSWATSGYKQQMAIDNNMIIGNGSFGLELLAGNGAPIIFRNNTTYGNGLAPPFQAAGVAEISIKEGNSNVLVDKDLIFSLARWATTGASTPAIDIYYATKVTVSNSFVYSSIGLFGLNGYTASGVTLSGVYLPNVINVTTASPNFVNPHQVTAAPDCSAATSVPQCLAQLIADFTPQAAGAVGLGYQPPGACAPNPDWPSWIGPGDVPDGIVTKPCGM
jgi:hypothetical protein